MNTPSWDILPPKDYNTLGKVIITQSTGLYLWYVSPLKLFPLFLLFKLKLIMDKVWRTKQLYRVNDTRSSWSSSLHPLLPRGKRKGDSCVIYLHSSQQHACMLLCKFSLGEDFPQWKAALSPCCPHNPPHSLPISHILLIFNTVILNFEKYSVLILLPPCNDLHSWLI